MFILTDGRNYIMENPMKNGEYLSTTSSIQAKDFTYKQANSLRQRKGKRYSWMRNFQIVNVETGEKSKTSPRYKGKEGIFIGENDINFDENILDKILEEANSIIGLCGWNMTQLEVYKNELLNALSKYDSAESDIKHVLELYEKEHNGKKPPAHKISKFGYLLADIRSLRRKIKQSLDYVQVMIDSITYKYTIEKTRSELNKSEHSVYRGRTEFYQIAQDILS